MDLSQTKLTRSEWNNIEIPTEKKELEIIKLICKGYSDIHQTHNDTLSLLQYLKIQPCEIIHEYVYCTYLQKHFQELEKRYNIFYKTVSYKKNKMKKADIIRFSNTDKQLDSFKSKIFEFIVLDLLKSMLSDIKNGNKNWYKSYFTIYTLMKYKIVNINTIFVTKIQELLSAYKDKIPSQPR